MFKSTSSPSTQASAPDPVNTPDRDAETSFQYMSDLHLEVGTKTNQQYHTFTFPVRAPYLILAGDIGRLIDRENYLLFLRLQADRFQRVFWVLGNHEFYEQTYAEATLVAETLTQDSSLEGKVTLLNKRRYDVAGTNVTVLGCTMWSRVRKDRKEEVELAVSDYKHIKGGWTVDDHIMTFEEEWRWLRGELEGIAREDQEREQQQHREQGHQKHQEEDSKGPRRRKVVVVTHHAPSTTQTAGSRRVGNAWASAYATDLLPKSDNSNNSWISSLFPKKKTKSSAAAAAVAPQYWIFGHTHFSTQFEKAGTKVLANQRGYVFPTEKPARSRRKSLEGGELEFDPEMTFEV